MIYVTNENKHYFLITPEAWECFDSDYLQRYGCDIHLSKKEMHEYLLSSYGYTLDQVDGNEISISLNEKGELVESCSRNSLSVVDEKTEDCNDWLAAYKL